MPPEALREAIAARSLPVRPPEGAVGAAAAQIVGWCGEWVRAIVFFGSRKTRAQPDAWSAHDYFVLTRRYLGFYRGLRAVGALRRAPRLAAALNAVLPPNQISLRGRDATGEPWHAKCAVIELDRFVSEASRRRRDHFVLGRLCQPVEIVFSESVETRRELLDALVSAHELTFSWVRPWLPEGFDATAYCRTMLRVSLTQEIRPEPGERADALLAAQAHDLLPVYERLLQDLEARGELTRTGESYALARPVSSGERLWLRLYFGWSLVRATARWAKYVITFDGWLDYIVRKAERHGGEKILLTPRERRFPLIFLWPRVFRYLRGRSRGSARP